MKENSVKEFWNLHHELKTYKVEKITCYSSADEIEKTECEEKLYNICKSFLKNGVDLGKFNFLVKRYALTT